MTDGPEPRGGEPAVALVDPPPGAAQRLVALGAPQLNLYRALAHAPALLEAWLDFAWSLRRDCVTPRALRELMILRTAIVMDSAYEWQQHRTMACDAGVPEEQVEALAAWPSSDRFDERERAALLFTDAVLSGRVHEAVEAEVARHFDEQERVELVLTASFYAMVPRVLDALRVPLEEESPPEGT